jgi:hypothetical protein
MKGRRIAAGLCAALAHVLVIFVMLHSRSRLPGEHPVFESEMVYIPLPKGPEVSPLGPPELASAVHVPAPSPIPDDASEVTAPAAISTTPKERVDWPIEAEKSAKRVLDAEAEAERVAKLFSGPNGTWASLTKRQRSQVKEFKWKQGVKPEYDDRGNLIYHLGEGCALINFSMIACALGKPHVNGDLFKEMKQYFDEQRLPETNDGNGTEKEALRPAR